MSKTYPDYARHIALAGVALHGAWRTLENTVAMPGADASDLLHGIRAISALLDRCALPVESVQAVELTRDLRSATDALRGSCRRVHEWTEAQRRRG